MAIKKINKDELLENNKAVNKEQLDKGLDSYRELKKRRITPNKGYDLENPYEKRAYKKSDDLLVSEEIELHSRQ